MTMNALRQATKALHRRVDHHPLLAPLVSADLNVAQYGLALSALHGFVQRGESVLAPCQDAGYDYVPRLHALLEDLGHLERLPIPFGAHLPEAENLDAAAGYLYVMEGSRMGGQFIAAHLAKSNSTYPCRFFGGGLAAESLRPDGAALARFVADRVQNAQVAAAAAMRMFESLLVHLDVCIGGSKAGQAPNSSVFSTTAQSETYHV